MLSRLLRHEWRTLTADSALWLVVAVFALAIGYGTFNGVRWTAFQRQAIVEAQLEEADRIQKQEAEIVRINRDKAIVSAYADPRNPDAVGRGLGSRYAIMPPSTLAPLSIGQSDLLPSYLKMTTDAKETVLAAAELENPQRLLTGRFDLAFVLVYLYPLLILAVTYNLLSAEKEQGTLVLALSQPVSLQVLVLGKVAIRLALFLGTIASLAMIALTIGGIDLGEPDVPSRFALWVAAVAAYGLFWFSLAVAVAAAGRGSSTNATILAGIWLVLVVLVPSMVNLIATTSYPVPSRVEMIQAMRVASDQANEQGSQVLAKYYEDHPELASGDAQQAMNDFNIVRVAVSADIERKITPVLDQHRRQLDAQQRMASRARFLSPAILMQDALNDVAGTGSERHRAFVTQVESYHARWREYFVRQVFRKVSLQDFAGIPRFTWVEEAADSAAARVAFSLMGLLLPAVAIGAMGLIRLRTYPVVS